MAKSPWEMFATDEKVEQTGIRVDYGSFYFMVARAGGANDKFRNLMREKLRPYERAIQLGEMDEKVSLRLTAEAFSEGAVLGWGKVVDGKDFPGVIVGQDGEDVKFSVGACFDMLMALPELLSDLMEKATNFTNFRKIIQEIDGKN